MDKVKHCVCAHSSCVASISLNLLKNTWKTKILNKHSVCAGNNYGAIQSSQKNAHMGGFSAGSYNSLSMCHILWRMLHKTVCGTLGGITFPPTMLSQIPVRQEERLLALTALACMRLSGFLRHLSRLVDMILAQMVPVKSPCRISVRRFSSCYPSRR